MSVMLTMFLDLQAQSLRAGKQQLRPKERRDEGALGGPGGRLSRRNLDPVAEAERKAQQEKLYALDLDKIMAGALLIGWQLGPLLTCCSDVRQ